jgi:ADP-ribose pyrophosphatase
MNSNILKSWEVLETKEIFVDEPWVRLSVQQVRLPDGRIIDDYYQIALVEYTSVYAQTADGKVLLERQYKQGVGKVTFTVPQGKIEKNEDPLASAQRELLEETGYASDDWQSLGSFICSANYGCGKAHIFIARNARKVTEPNSGDLEEMEVVLMKPKDIVDMIHRGEIHTLGTVAAIAIAQNPSFASTEADT